MSKFEIGDIAQIPWNTNFVDRKTIITYILGVIIDSYDDDVNSKVLTCIINEGGCCNVIYVDEWTVLKIE